MPGKAPRWHAPLYAARDLVGRGVGVVTSVGRATAQRLDRSGHRTDATPSEASEVSTRPTSLDPQDQTHDAATTVPTELAAPRSLPSRGIAAGREQVARIIDRGTRAAAGWMVERVDLSSVVVATTGGALDRVLGALRSTAATMDSRVDDLVERLTRRRVEPAPPQLLEQAPPGTPTAPGAPARASYAGFVSRGAALALDAVAVVVVYYGLVGVGVLVRALVNLDPPRAPNPDGWVWAASFGVWGLAYLALGWSIAGRTIGQAVLGLRVVTTRGTQPGIGWSLVRAAGYPLSATVAGLGFAWAALSTRRRCWHDYLARTYVVHGETPTPKVVLTSRRGTRGGAAGSSRAPPR